MSSKKALKKAIHIFLSKLHSKSYRDFLNERDIDIAEVSKRNLQQLYQILKTRQWVPEAEKQKYGDKLFSSQEFALWETWRSKIVPLFTLKHATKAVTFDVLSPINSRLKQGKVVSKNHTGGSSAERGFSYFVLGVGDKHYTPNFLGSEVDTILVKLGKIDQRQGTLWRGLWIGGHIQQYYDEAELDPMTFGSTTRTLQFTLVDGKPGIKTYFYKRSDGSIIIRNSNYQDEIFAADQNLNTIFDALFFQFIIELRLIGGEFQQYIFNNANNIETINTAFHSLFQSWVYPEAHLPNSLTLLNNLYIEIIKNPANHFQLTQKWFNAAKTFDIKTLLQCINEGIDVNLLNEDHRNALLVVMTSIYPVAKNDLMAVVKFLIDHGSDITIRTILGESLLDLAIEKNLLILVEQFLAGISHHKIPFIKYHINTNKTHRTSQHALIICAKCGNLDAATILFNYGTKISSTLPILNAIYCRNANKDKKGKLIEFFVEHGANLEARDSQNQTVLHQAAGENDYEIVDFLLTLGADINATVSIGNSGTNIDVNAGRTALHLAVLAGAKEVVEVLLARGARIDIADEWGDTAYFLMLDELNKGLELYIKKNANEFRALLNMWQITNQHQDIQMHLRNPIEQMTQGFKQHQENLQAIKSLFEKTTVVTNRPVKTPLQLCKTRIFTCVGLVTAYINAEPYVLFVRKKNDIFEKAYGFYLAPGGFKNYTEDYRVALQRELIEETNLKVNLEEIVEIFTYQKLNDSKQKKTFKEIKFFHINLGNIPKLPNISARSDAAEARFVKWSDVVKEPLNNSVTSHSFQDIRINQSNVELLTALFTSQPINQAQVNGSLYIEQEGAKELNTAIKTDDSAKIIELCQKGLDLNKTIGLLYACELGKFELVKLLITLGADVNQVYKNFVGTYSPLIWAIDNQQSALVKILIDKFSANINLGAYAVRPIVRACAVNNLDIIDFLLTKNIVWDNEVTGTALMGAIYHNNLAAGKKIIVLSRVNLNLVYKLQLKNGELELREPVYPLFAALYLARSDFFELLLDHNASLDISNNGSSIIACLITFLKQHRKYDKYEEQSQAISSFSLFDAFKNTKVLRATLPNREGLIKIANVIIKHLSPNGDTDNSELKKLIALLNKQSTEVSPINNLNTL